MDIQNAGKKKYRDHYIYSPYMFSMHIQNAIVISMNRDIFPLKRIHYDSINGAQFDTQNKNILSKT